MFESFFRRQTIPGQTKIAMMILDGLGGLPKEPGGKTELETAYIPHLDALAGKSALGLSVPLGPGVTVGSGPGHLALFGYDPLECEIGRGPLEALGVDFDLHPEDVAARGNFCTLDENGIIIDRRAGRLPTQESRKLVEILREIKVDGVEIFLETVKEHRFALILRGEGLGSNVSETDPLLAGKSPIKLIAHDVSSQKTADIVNQLVEKAQRVLASEKLANMILLRGFAKLPSVPSFMEMYQLNATCIAVNGMYRGVSRLAGMHIQEVNGYSLADEFSTLEKVWQDFDFFYLHFKKTDTCGENGDFEGKVEAIEEFDRQIPRLMALNPDVVIVTGDHSSPAVLKFHSWHPVPLMIYSKYCRSDAIPEFGERACARGSLGQVFARHIMPIALANAGRVAKYGA
ncbi:MAG: 2,3-bisphosphoglycerate-independent phosphoglycerate mutase [Anaerolineaceae bacterium]|jgi:2,3-bisphosphoglycerate-independent phosphoglycerate mutase|nr:2,3-bisphosphoglycerate-independent phosphoglycerate mutase [Anaerolineaceae bacterium]